MVKLLVTKGANPTARDRCGCTPPLRAIINRRLDVLRYLLLHHHNNNNKDGVMVVDDDIDARSHDGMTVLWWSCCWGYSHILRLLLDLGADPLMGNNNGTTPLDMAKGGNKLRSTRMIEVGRYVG